MVIELQPPLSFQTFVNSHTGIASNNGQAMIQKHWWRCLKGLFNSVIYIFYLMFYSRFICLPLLAMFLQRWPKPYHPSWMFATLLIGPTWTTQHSRHLIQLLLSSTHFRKCLLHQEFDQLASHSHSSTHSPTTATSSKSLVPQEESVPPSQNLNISPLSRNPGTALVATRPLGRC